MAQRVLVVDDESRMRKLVKDFLVKNNYEVVEAEDGSTALDIFFWTEGCRAGDFRCYDAKNEWF